MRTHQVIRNTKRKRQNSWKRELLSFDGRVVPITWAIGNMQLFGFFFLPIEKSFMSIDLFMIIILFSQFHSEKKNIPQLAIGL
jgi:hypothetical protein